VKKFLSTMYVFNNSMNKLVEYVLCITILLGRDSNCSQQYKKSFNSASSLFTLRFRVGPVYLDLFFKIRKLVLFFLYIMSLKVYSINEARRRFNSFSKLVPY
jgi:hypothetical protein